MFEVEMTSLWSLGPNGGHGNVPRRKGTEGCAVEREGRARGRSRRGINSAIMTAPLAAVKLAVRPK
jgi:hypothetical protein